MNILCNILGVDMIKSCALIGSRKAPNDVLILASTLGRFLSENGVESFSGGANGMDNAFMRHYDPTLRKIFLPNKKFYNHVHNGYDKIALDYLPNVSKAIKEVKTVSVWDELEINVKRLFCRNVYQVLGYDLNSPVDCVIFWALENCGSVKGGTRIAVNIARKYNIPCFNLAFQKNRTAIEKFLGGSDLSSLGI